MDPEIQRLRNELARRVTSDRRRLPVIAIVLVAAILLIGIVIYQFPGDSRNPAILLGIVAVGLLTFATSRFFPGVHCPRCEKKFDDQFAAYCPECGAHGLDVTDRHYKADCRNCKSPLGFTGRGETGHARTRLFQIRFCTNCGLSFGQRPL